VGSGWNLSNVLGHVLELAKDQEGSRFIQHNLDAKRANPADVVDAVFDEVLEDPMSLMTDVFGNYVVQKMLDAATPAQLVRIAKRFAGHVLELTLHTFGCRVVQKAIQVFPREGLDTILSELRGHVAHCVQDQNGNHVIQKAIEQMPGDTDFVIQSFLGRVPEFATHAYGCRVIQCIFTHSPNRQDAVLAEIVQHTESLAQDQFGNYVVQHVLQSPDDAAAVAKMVLTLMPKYAQLSMHKFASNVMEKVYQRATPEQRMQVLKGLTTTDNAKGVAPLVTLMKDQFGNYVVQRMIDHSTGPEKEVMVEAIKPHIPDLRRVTFGKHIISRLERVSSLPAGTANGKA
jgi:pumilio RNA-binding family